MHRATKHEDSTCPGCARVWKNHPSLRQTWRNWPWNAKSNGEGKGAGIAKAPKYAKPNRWNRRTENEHGATNKDNHNTIKAFQEYLEQGMDPQQAGAKILQEQVAAQNSIEKKQQEGLTDDEVHKQWGLLKSTRELVERRSAKDRRLRDNLARAEEQLQESAGKHAHIQIALDAEKERRRGLLDKRDPTDANSTQPLE